MELATFIATLVGALATAGLGVIAFRLSRQAQEYTVQRAIGDLQSTLAAYRAEHPEVMHESVRWSTKSFARLYGAASNEANVNVVRYYSYVDIGLEFCNTTLAAASTGRLPTDVFENHYRPLVRQFLAENYPFVAGSLAAPYISRYVRDELAVAEAEGWNWAEKHQLLRADPGA